MDLNFVKGITNPKLAELEKNLQVAKEALETSSINFGEKILKEAEEGKTNLPTKPEFLDNWTKDVTERQHTTDTILEIKSLLERQEQLKNLVKDTEKLIAARSKEVTELKEEFAFTAYKAHRDDFTEALDNLPQLSELEAQIEAEKAKISGRSEESKASTIFGKIVPTVKNIMSKGKVSTTESKLKKLIEENASVLFSDADFENMFGMLDELPEDLSSIAANLKEATSIVTSATAKLEETAKETESVAATLHDIGVEANSKSRLSELMAEIKTLDEKIENTALMAGSAYVDNFFDADGKATDMPLVENDYEKQIKNIGELRKKWSNAKIAIEIEKHTEEIADLSAKIKANDQKIEKAKKQIENLNAEIAENESLNSDMDLLIKDLEAKIKDLQEKMG